jgi:hypothetical protein
VSKSAVNVQPVNHMSAGEIEDYCVKISNELLLGDNIDLNFIRIVKNIFFSQERFSLIILNVTF